MTQAQALQILKTGANVFLTGQPGAGKTYTINQYVEWLNDHDIYPAITASTGIAATHIGGTTIHSWAGIGDFLRPLEERKEIKDAAIYELVEKPWMREKFAMTKVLIIDEISMLDARTFDFIDRVCKIGKKNEEPFGGMQVILVGDFYQLPPVSKNKTAKFVFESFAWDDLQLKKCVLHEQHRQEDMDFLEILTAVRNGNATKEHVKKLKTRIVPKEFAKVESHVTRLFTKNVSVDALNETKLRELDAEEKTYTMEEEGNPHLVTMLKKNCLSPERLTLKVGALVMFTHNNFEEGYANGTLGEVVGFDKMTGFPTIETAELTITPGYEEWSIKNAGSKKVQAAIRQIPLKLAWAMTVHKCQGMSLDSASIDLSDAFEHGQGYVALSRVRSLKGLYLDGLNDKALSVHPLVQEVDASFISESAGEEKQLSLYSADALRKMEDDFVRSMR